MSMIPFSAYLTLVAMVAQYRIFLAIVSTSAVVYLVLRFKMKDDVALGKALVVFFSLLTMWMVTIWIFIFPTMKM